VILGPLQRKPAGFLTRVATGTSEGEAKMSKMPRCIRRGSLFALVLGLLTGVPLWVSQAQTGCPPVSNNGWSKCATVYYTMTGFDAAQAPQITSALSAWHQANLGNNSHVRFVQGAPPPTAENYGTLTVQTATPTSSGAAADTVKNTTSGPIISATITTWVLPDIALSLKRSCYTSLVTRWGLRKSQPVPGIV